MPKFLYRVKLSTGDLEADPHIVSEYVSAADEDEAMRLAPIFAEKRGHSVQGVADLAGGHFVENLARFPVPRPEAHWEELEKDLSWRFEFSHLAFVCLAKTERGYMAWLELNGIPSIEDTDLSGTQTLEEAQRGACGFAANQLLSMIMLLNKQVVR
jgi:hypothetical protein